MKRTLKKFQDFKNSLNFNFIELKKTDDGIFFGNVCLEKSTGEKIFEGENFINISFKSRTSIAKILSNLFPYSFKFKGKKVASIEGVLQAIKYKDKKTQNLVLKYSGLDAYHTRGCNNYDFWGNTGLLYWQGKEIKRNSKEYQTFLDELYLSALKNLLYKRALISSGNKYLIHHIGRDNINETVLTRYEYESRLYYIREFLKVG